MNKLNLQLFAITNPAVMQSITVYYDSGVTNVAIKNNTLNSTNSSVESGVGVIYSSTSAQSLVITITYATGKILDTYSTAYCTCTAGTNTFNITTNGEATLTISTKTPSQVINLSSYAFRYDNTYAPNSQSQSGTCVSTTAFVVPNFDFNKITVNALIETYDSSSSSSCTSSTVLTKCFLTKDEFPVSTSLRQSTTTPTLLWYYKGQSMYIEFNVSDKTHQLFEGNATIIISGTITFSKEEEGSSDTSNLKLGSTQVSNVYLGTTQVQKIYLGSTVVWSKTS